MGKSKFRVLAWLYGKVLLIAVAGVIITQLILFVVYSQRNNTAEFRINRDVIARQVINLIQTLENTPPAQQQEIAKALNLPNINVSLDDKAKYHPRFRQTSLWRVLIKISDQTPNIRLSFLLESNQWLNVSANIEPISWHFQIFMLALEISLTLVILFSLWNIHRFTGPLKKFTKAAESLGVNLRADPLPIDGPAPVRATAYAMNKMQERIQDLIAARTQMLAAISHDLRTPITRMKLRAQYIKEDTLQQKMINDLDQMEEMIAETLSFAREDARQEKQHHFDFSSLLSSMCDDYAEIGKHVVFDGIFNKVAYTGGLLAIKRMLANLIDNAVKYGQKANVGLASQEKKVIIEIRDQGKGLPKEQLESVFLPFYREQSRSRETGGIGLGLAVARDIARAHGGDIVLYNHPDGGLVARVILPVL